MDLFYGLKVELAGNTYYFAEKTTTISGRVYDGVLSRVSLSKIVQSDTTVSIQVISGEQWSQLFRANGNIVDGGSATLYLIDGDRILESWMPGIVNRVSWGSSWQPLSFEITTRITNTRQIISPTARIYEETFPISLVGDWTIPATSYGANYNIIIGYPGYREGSKFGDYTQCVVPVLYCEFEENFIIGRILVAGGVIEATSITAINYSQDSTRYTLSLTDPETQPITDNRDLIGGVINDIYQSGIESASDDEIYVGFDPTNGGGLLFEGSILRGGADIFKWVVTRFTDMKLDIGRHKANADFLNLYKFDTFINSDVDPLEWFESQVLEYLPAKICRSSDGYYLAVLPRYGHKKDVCLKLIAGQNAERIGQWSVDSECYNEIIADFSLTKNQQDYYDRLIITGRYGALPDTVLTSYTGNVIKDQLCKTSQEVYGVKQLFLTMPTIYSTDTAIRVATDHAIEKCFPKKQLQYTLSTDYWYLDVGSMITVTDNNDIDGLSLNGEIFRIDDVVVDSQQVVITVSPIRQATGVGSSTQYL